MRKTRASSFSKGAEAAIYRKYVPKLWDFLRTQAKYDIDNDGKLWCSKDDWNAFLFPFISEDDGNAIGYRHCHEKTNDCQTSNQMLELIRMGKKYICHRVYNMRFIKNLEKRKAVNGFVSHFRLLDESETPTPPVSNSIYSPRRIIKRLFLDKGQCIKKRKYKLTLDEACEGFMAKLDDRFSDERTKIAEWRKAINALISCKEVIFKNGEYIYSPKK
jgi:hypothetical protein